MRAIIVFVIIACSVLCSCATRAGHADITVLEYQRQLDEYQGAVSSFIDRAADAARTVERIRGRADTIESTIDATIDLFDEYQRAVDVLIREYINLRAQIEAGVQDGASPAGAAGD